MQFTGKRFEMTEDEYQEYEEGMVGLCLSCGEENQGCESDARSYSCGSCNEREVYGVPELLIMGLVGLIGEDDDE